MFDICSRVVMTDLFHPRLLYFTNAKSTNHFSIYHSSPPALHCRDSAYGFIYPSNSVSFSQGYLLSSNSSPSWSALWFHHTALSAPPSRPPTSVIIRYFSSGCTACWFPNRLTTHLFSGRRCHPIQCSELVLKNSSFSSDSFSTFCV